MLRQGMLVNCFIFWLAPGLSLLVLLSLLDVGGEVLVISQFTLYADTRRGRRLSFTNAAPPVVAETLFEHFKESLASYGLTVASGIFGASMTIEIRNEGPVTIWLDSEEL